MSECGSFQTQALAERTSGCQLPPSRSRSSAFRPKGDARLRLVFTIDFNVERRFDSPVRRARRDGHPDGTVRITAQRLDEAASRGPSTRKFATICGSMPRKRCL